MKNEFKKMIAVLAISSFGAFGLIACDKDGPAENFGESVDEAAQDVKRGVEDATD
jgi:predicted small lipoprotein YifL